MDQIRALAVDLDGTLIRTDMLYEGFWSAFSQKWWTPFAAAHKLRGGRSHLKSWLSGMAKVDLANLPYNQDVLDYVRRWREAGGRAVLVTASDQLTADGIAAHLGLFDEAHGSGNGVNLKGSTKAAFLVERFGEGGYAYIGDSAPDLAVWRSAGKVITVNASPALLRRTRALGRPVEEIRSDHLSARAYIKAMRPHQWLKNALIFLPMFAAHRLEPATILTTVAAFVAFSLIASSVYLVNDLLDLSADRAHARKRFRPLAAGTMAIHHGTFLSAVLAVIGFGIAVAIGLPFALALLGYLVLTTAYSLSLKRKLIIDICVLAGLYTMRIIAGGLATGIPLSVWLLAFSIFFFLSLAAVKRQGELVDGVASGTVKAQGRGYHVDDLQLVSQIAISAGYVSVLVMALYLNSPTVAELYGHPKALWGICPLLLYWISRMVMMAHRGQMHDDPIVFAVKDRISQASALLVLGFALVGALW